MTKKNFNEVLKQREIESKKNENETKEISLDSLERVKVLSPGQLVFKRFVNNKLAILGSAILIFMFLFSFVFPIFYPYSQTEIFYKYDASVVDYAIASDRTEYSLVLNDKETEIPSTVKNNMTGLIKNMQAEGLTEATINDNDGNSYIVKEDSENIYTLYSANMEEVCVISEVSEYATYNSIFDSVEYLGDEVEGFQEELKNAIENNNTEFTLNGVEYTITAGRKNNYSIAKEGEGIVYAGSNLGISFEESLEQNLEMDGFTHEGVDYIISKVDGVITVSKVDGSTQIAYLTNYVFDVYDSSNVLTDEFKTKALESASKDSSFEVDGVKYTTEVLENEVLVFDANDESVPYASLSTMAIRAYTGEDSLEFAYKEKVREVVEEMQETGVNDASFEWELAQVNSEGVYNLDEQGNPIKELTTIDVTNKNGSYVMKCEQVTYLIDIFARPSSAHWFGTDGDGMDVLARMMYGGRVSLLVCFVVIIIQTVLGVVMGGVAGFFGGITDNIIMRMVDIFYCIPSMPLLIIMGALLDAMKMKPYTRVICLMIVLGVLGWAGVARLIRGQILSLREQEFMVAAEAIGLRNGRRIFKHLVPNVMPQLIVNASAGLGGIIITESTLSFLGLGVKHPLATWGTMINSVSTAEQMVRYTYIWIPVGLLICFTVIAFNFVGDGLRDAFDPKMKR